MPVGYVLFVREKEGDGFVGYQSKPGSAFLDLSAHFYAEDLLEEVGRGCRVSFDLGASIDALATSPPARNVRRDDFTGRSIGTIKFFYSVSKGVLTGEDGLDHLFTHREIIPDSIGRFMMPQGARVSYELSTDGASAIYVRSEEPDAFADPTGYIERGTVISWDGVKGFIRRPSGDHLEFGDRDFTDGRVSEVAPGVVLQYGIKDRTHWVREQGRFRFYVFAADIFLADYSPDSFEAQFLSAPELPLSASGIYSPEERRLPLREIIRRRKQQAA